MCLTFCRFWNEVVAQISIACTKTRMSLMVKFHCNGVVVRVVLDVCSADGTLQGKNYTHFGVQWKRLKSWFGIEPDKCFTTSTISENL